MTVFKYKHGYIRPYKHTDLVQVQIGYEKYYTRSVKAAKLLITRHIDGGLR